MGNVEHYIVTLNRYEKKRGDLNSRPARNLNEIAKVEKKLKKLYQWAKKEGYGVGGVIWIVK